MRETPPSVWKRPALISLAGFIPLAVAFAFLFGLSFLPPDTSRREVDARGIVRVCMPTEYPPLVTGNPDAPGFEVELVTEIAERAGWRLSIAHNAAMGRDINPRSWRITRAQCNFIAGGVALTTTSRSFLDTTAGHMQTGWMMVSPEAQKAPIAGQRAGYYAGLSGLDRIALGQYLRASGVEVAFVPNAAALQRGLANGDYDIAITEALSAHSSFSANDGWVLTWLPEELGSFQLGFGFWRGDTTLRKHVEDIMADLEDEGITARLAAQYGLTDEILCESDDEDCE